MRWTSVAARSGCEPEAADQVLAGTAATDGAKAATIPAEAHGVYREGSRKAWYVDCPSPFDQKGAILFVR